MPISSSEYDAWTARHSAMFGFSHANDPAMFSLWFGVFAAAGYTASELRFATDTIAGRSEPLKWREHHLAQINKAIRDRREQALAQRLREFPEDETGPGVCSNCNGTGWVSVPNPKQIHSGRWEPAGMHGYSEAVVACFCSRGRVRRDKWDAAPAEYKQRISQPMSLEHYESRYCADWRRVLREHHERLEAFDKAKSLAEVADKAKPLAAAVNKALANAGAA